MNLFLQYQVRWFLSLLFLVVVVPHAYTQTHGYAFAGSTVGIDAPDSNAFRYGIGGNWGFLRHLTLGGEAGGLHEDGNEGMLASGNVGFHFRGNVETGFDPFVTAGLTGIYVGGETSGYTNIGGGLNYWFRPRIGFRVEFRGYPGGEDRNGFSEFRFGIAFR
ncbi:MAG: hypothetical protein ABFD60_07220 [Bryobacteraceae bacterium]